MSLQVAFETRSSKLPAQARNLPPSGAPAASKESVSVPQGGAFLAHSARRFASSPFIRSPAFWKHAIISACGSSWHFCISSIAGWASAMAFWPSRARACSSRSSSNASER